MSGQKKINAADVNSGIALLASANLFTSNNQFTGNTQAHRGIDAQTGTTYTLALTDADSMVTLNNASTITLTIPTNASVAFPVNTEIDISQLGAGQVTISPAGGVTLNYYSPSSAASAKLTGQYCGATLKQTATNVWICIGNLV